MAGSKTTKNEAQWTLDHARRAAIAAQGLHRDGGSIPDILDRTGFIRTLGGADVYVAARARVAGCTRRNLDIQVEAGELKVSPTVRGCIYLVTRSHAPASLRLADLLSRRRSEREQEKAGIRPGEIETVAAAVLDALQEGPLSTQDLRKRLPEDLLRSLGDAGKKVGISSPLPPALRRLEFDGRLERLVENGRLDTERYLWRWVDGDAGTDLEPATVHVHMARVYLRAAGFGTADGFAEWSGLGRRDARAAVDQLPTFPITIEGIDEPFLALEESREPLESPPEEDPVAFLPFEDNLVAFRQGPAFFVDPEHHHIPVPVWGRGKGSTLGDVRHGALRPIVAESRIVGFWELDPDAEEVVTGLFAEVADATRDRVAEEAVALGTFLVKELGHGRSFSIDTEKHLRKRCEHIRNLERS